MGFIKEIVGQILPDFGQILQLLLPLIPWLVIVFVVASYFLAQYYMRKIFVRVEYHRKGPSAETFPCTEVGNRVFFETGSKFKLFGKSKSETIRATISAKPEIKVFGFRTIRLHHVLEGFGETVDIRDLRLKSPMGGGAIAVSESVMQTAFENLARSVPKAKSEWLMLIMAMMAGLGSGFSLGVIFE